MLFGKGRISFLGLSVFLFTAACGADGKFPEPQLTGPFGAGKAEYTFTDEVRDRTLPTSVWYPSEESGAPDKSGAPYPLVLFSHGSGGSRGFYTFITEHLASHGFVVAAPDHQGNVGIENFIPEEPYMMVKRPLDISFTLDRLLGLEENGDPVLSGLFDPEEVGASGHSFGGYTTLALSGAVIQAEEFKEICSVPDANPRCSFLDLPDEIPDLSDPRIKAGVTLAAGLNDLWGLEEQGVATVSIPMMTIGGSSDILVPAVSLELVHAVLPPNPKYFVMIAGGGHTGFTDSGNLDGTLNSERMWEIVRVYTTAFFKVYLAGDRRYEKYLATEYAGGFAGAPPDFTFLREPE